MRLLAEGQFQQAEGICVEWMTLEPENPPALWLLGRACEGQGRAEDARRAFSKVEAFLNSNQ